MASTETDLRERLRQHFSQLPPDQQAGAWNAMWEQHITPWDRGEPSPALVDTLTSKTSLFGSPFQHSDTGKTVAVPPRKKALVPGCGRGYDVFLLAALGYDAYGLDTSELAVEGARQLADHPDRDSKYPPVKDGRGEAKFFQADFFKDDFLTQTKGGGFDLIYDYTFLCALPPALRPRWAKRMSELLAPAGHLVCLEFPLQKEPKAGGPPHGLTGELYEQLLNRPGVEVKYNPGGYVLPDRSVDLPQDALVMVERWKAERTHAPGMGSDHVSIWRHR